MRAFAAALALAATASAHADYKDSYSRGLEAVRDGNWNEVRSRMREAIGEQATPATRVRLYGQRWEPYVPQFYLGLAAFKQGDCAGALREWRSAANAGVIGSVPNLKAEQDRNAASCESRVAEQSPPAKPPVAEAPKPPVTETTKPPVAPPDKTKPEPPKQEPVKPEPKPESPKSEPVKPEPPKPVPVAQRVPAPLLDAYRAWLTGRYADVARINPDSYTEPRAKAQALLVRAAARQVQAELDGNAELLDAARTSARAVRALDPKLTPDAAMFSPRFRAFYAATK